MQKQAKKPPSTDLILVASASKVAFLAVIDGHIRQLTQVPAAVFDQVVLGEVLASTIRAGRPRRVRIWVRRGARRHVVEELVDALHDARAEFGFVVDWLPDLDELRRAVHTPSAESLPEARPAPRVDAHPKPRRWWQLPVGPLRRKGTTRPKSHPGTRRV